MKRKKLRGPLAVLLACVLIIGSVYPASAAQTGGEGASDGTAAVQAGASKTAASPTYNQELARKVLAAMGVVTGSQTTAKGLKKQVSRRRFAQMLVELSPYRKKVGTTVKTSLYTDVKKTDPYAPYIRIAVENGWMKGNLKGKFRPTQTVTLQEGIVAVLAMLGYVDSDFQGSLASAKFSFYQSQKLNKNIKKKAGGKLTYKDTVNLLYNMLVTPDKAGNIYGQTLGYALDANGDIDYLTLVYDKLDGPVIAGEDWRSQIPFDVSGAVIYIDGSKAGAERIRPYDVLYYSKKLNSIFVYQDRVTGRLNGVSPDRYKPTAVTVSGTSYVLADQDIAYAVSAMGSYEIGDYVTLLLGKDGKVVGIGGAATLNSFIGGIVLSTTEKVSGDKNSTDVKKYITMLDTLGETHEYEVEDLKGFSENTPVEIAFDNGKPVVNKVSLSRLNGTVNADATTFAGYRLSESIRILEYDSSGSYSTIERSRLAGLTINFSNILYYHVNADKEITDFMIRGVTGDSYRYGILLSATEVASPEMMTFMGSYSYLIDGKQGSAGSSGQIFGVQGYTGPAQFGFGGDGSVTSVKMLGSISVTSITLTEVSDGKHAYRIADGVGVYLKQGSSYYLTELPKVMSLSNYELTAYYDGTTSGRVRVIVAKAKE
ncbi:S-layer homology domain-containing protein [Lachnospiraceae bacterium 47-T17]